MRRKIIPGLIYIFCLALISYMFTPSCQSPAMVLHDAPQATATR